MRQYELVERVLKYDPKADEGLLNRAYVYAMKAHSHQKRDSGLPYFTHPLEVAAILTDLKLDDATIATALLHDVIEDTDATRTEIDQKFGKEIGALVDGLTKIKKLDLVSKQTEQAENFRKLLIAISTDIRVLLVKLADRLHNMRTLEHKRPESRQRTSEETLDIYAPLAGRMGMQELRDELEDHAFRWLYPEAYAALNERLAQLRERNKGLVGEIRQAVIAKLAEAGIAGDVSGREKKPYSIWRKMQSKQTGLEQLSDIYGFRLVVATVPDCYQVLGLVHTTWRTVPGRFKDYISTPKQNGYQSIHTTVVGPRHQRVELQIRTQMMHQVADFGVAAHALYKDRASARAQSTNGSAAQVTMDSGPYEWLRHLVSTLLDGSNQSHPEEFLEHTKLELFQDQVFCFTPKGRLIALPRGATPIDFAYAVHTDVGNSTVGAIVNGRQQPLTTVLRNGDEVQVLTAVSQIPPAAWERIAVTGRARSAIRRATRDADRRRYAELGRRLVSARTEKLGLEISDDRIRKVLGRLAHKSVEDVMVAIGRNDLAVADVVRAIAPEMAERLTPVAAQKTAPKRDAQAQDGWFNLARAAGLKFRDPAGDLLGEPDGAVAIRGAKHDLPVTFEDGGALPGDRVVGVTLPQGGIKIFQIHSPKLRDYEEARWIDVRWDVDPDKPERFPARIGVTILNEPGTLAQIAQVIGDADGNIDNLRMTRRAVDFTEMVIEVEVWDLAHLERILAGLKAKAVVGRAERLFE